VHLFGTYEQVKWK